MGSQAQFTFFCLGPTLVSLPSLKDAHTLPPLPLEPLSGVSPSGGLSDLPTWYGGPLPIAPWASFCHSILVLSACLLPNKEPGASYAQINALFVPVSP